MSRRLTILHLRGSTFVGGPERQVLRYASFERSGPLSVFVGTFLGPCEGKEFLAMAKQQGIQTLALPSGRLGYAAALLTLTRFLADHKVSLVCTHGYKEDVMGMLAARVRGVPVASFLRGWTSEDWKASCYEALNRALLPLTKRIVCLSETQASRLAGRPSLRQKTRVVVNAIEFRATSEEERLQARREISRRLKLPQDSPLVATAGRLSPEKGVIHFIEAVPAIRKRYHAAQFIVFGDGPLRTRLERAARALCPSGEVCFAGRVPDFLQLLPGIDVLVNPSLSEEMPNVILEAMAAGVPVVGTNVGGVEEIAGDAGLVLVPPSHPPSIAREVSVLLSGSARAEEQGRAGQQRVRGAFSPSRQCAQLRALYEELIPGLAGLWSTSGDCVDRCEEDGREASATIRRVDQLPFISVVMPVRNEEVHLGPVLEDLLAQEYPRHRYEVLVVDGGSTDSTTTIAERYVNLWPGTVRVLHNPGRLSSAGRNEGIRASQGEIIAFIDGHCRIPSAKFLLETAGTLDKTGADCLSRPAQFASPGNTWFQDVVAHARASLIGHGLDSTIYSFGFEGFVNPVSAGAIYRRSVFDRVGLHDERFDACEDVEFNYRVFKAGLRSYSSPAVTVYYHPRGDLWALFKQLVRYGRGRFRFIRKHPSALSISQLVPATFLAWVVLGGLAGLRSIAVREAWLATLIFYAFAVAGSSAVLAFRHGWRHFFVAPAVYPTIHFGLGAGFWVELVASFLGRSRREPLTAGKAQPSSASGIRRRPE